MLSRQNILPIRKVEMQSAVILVVEDEKLLLDLLVEALKDGGFELLMAKNGREALAALDTSHDQVRGLVTDINLGKGPDGWDVARRGRELISGLPIVYMSGASAHEWTSHGVPGSILISKPFAPAQVVTAISTLMNTSEIQLK